MSCYCWWWRHCRGDLLSSLWMTWIRCVESKSSWKIPSQWGGVEKDNLPVSFWVNTPGPGNQVRGIGKAGKGRNHAFSRSHQVWRGAVLLADFILAEPDTFRGATVLELGAGTGLTSIVMATVAKTVYCTGRTASSTLIGSWAVIWMKRLRAYLSSSSSRSMLRHREHAMWDAILLLNDPFVLQMLERTFSACARRT